MATKKKTPKKKAAPIDKRKLGQWKRKGEVLASAKWSNQWKIGDWILAGVRRFGTTHAYDAAQKATGMRRATLYQFKDTAECFPISTRVKMKNLFFGHYRLVADNDYTPERRQELLQFAVDNEETVASFAAYLKTLQDDASGTEERSEADVAAAKVIEACSAFLRNYNFDKLLSEPPTDDVRAEVLEELKKGVAELNDKIEMLTTVWHELVEADAKFLAAQSKKKAKAVGAGR
jgi:hypothetical protein